MWRTTIIYRPVIVRIWGIKMSVNLTRKRVRMFRVSSLVIEKHRIVLFFILKFNSLCILVNISVFIFIEMFYQFFKKRECQTAYVFESMTILE